MIDTYYILLFCDGATLLKNKDYEMSMIHIKYENSPYVFHPTIKKNR
jgi:hypothetical protein